MDEAVEIPVLGIRIGLDAALGLLPALGDVVTAAVAGWIVVTAARMGAPGPVVARMLLNLAVDATVGAAPFLGDIFDIGFRANRRNTKLLELHVADPEGALRGSRRLVWATVGAVVGTVALLMVLLGWILGVVSSVL